MATETLPQSEQQTITCELEPASDQAWNVRWHNSHSVMCKSIPELLICIEYEWFTAIQRHHAGNLLFFHASAATIAGHAVLIAGDPDAGKSTLANTFNTVFPNHVVGDELIALDPRSNQIAGLRRGLKFDTPRDNTVDLAHGCYVVPSYKITWAKNTWHDLSLFIVLDAAGASAEYNPLTTSEATQILYKHCLNSLSFEDAGMEALTVSVARTPSITLSRKPPNSMIGTIEGVLRARIN